MLLGAFILAIGCHTICQNEDIWLLLQDGLAEVMSAPLELPCRPNATLRAPVVHLQGCGVRGARLSAATPGLEELRLFQGCFPDEGVIGAWLKVNLERYNGNQQEWVPVPQADNLRTTEEVSLDALVGGFKISKNLARMIPGTAVKLKACNGSAVDPTATLSARTMRVHGHALYSGDPILLDDGDVRVTFLVGDAEHVSVLAAVSDGRLHLWHARLHGLHALTALPKLGTVEAGTVPAKVLQRRLAPGAQVSFWHLWPLRTIGLSLIWVGMSLLLFPNHVYPDFCGKYCCVRSLPGALVTTVATAGASWCYYHAETATSAAVLVLAPLLLALAAGVDLRSWLRQAIDCVRKSANGAPPNAEPDIPYHVLEATGHTGGWRFGRATRTGAFGVGLGLVVAGPAVQSFAFISALGDFWDGKWQ